VEQAVYTKTLENDPENGHNIFKKWSDWSPDVAAEKLRILLSKQPYMNLYAPDQPATHPMKDFKKEVLRRVRNTGILAYRVVKQANGESLCAGVTYSIRDLIFYPARNLTRPDVLRDRGIKVIAAGFGDLKPVKEDVRKRLMQVWLSRKKREAELKLADNKLEAERIKNHARVRAQQSMIYFFTNLLENQKHSREALAMLIYQELEAAAANPETRKLLPENTLNLLTGIGEWLLPGARTEKPRSEPPTLNLGEHE
jgi:hypothetical protein